MAQKRLYVAGSESLLGQLVAPLQAAGFIVGAFTSGAALTKGVRFLVPDALLMRYQLSDGPALQTYLALPERPPTVIILTPSQAPQRTKLIEAGIAEVAMSPLRMSELAEQMFEVAGGVRRTEKRIKATLTATIRIGDRQLAAVTNDVSSRGLGLTLLEALPIQSTIMVHLQGAFGSMEVCGRVLSDRSERDTRRVGVRLVGLSAEEAVSLRDLAKAQRDLAAGLIQPVSQPPPPAPKPAPANPYKRTAPGRWAPDAASARLSPDRALETLQSLVEPRKPEAPPASLTSQPPVAGADLEAPSESQVSLDSLLASIPESSADWDEPRHTGFEAPRETPSIAPPVRLQAAAVVSPTYEGPGTPSFDVDLDLDVSPTPPELDVVLEDLEPIADEEPASSPPAVRASLPFVVEAEQPVPIATEAALSAAIDLAAPTASVPPNSVPLVAEIDWDTPDTEDTRTPVVEAASALFVPVEAAPAIEVPVTADFAAPPPPEPVAGAVETPPSADALVPSLETVASVAESAPPPVEPAPAIETSAPSKEGAPAAEIVVASTEILPATAEVVAVTIEQFVGAPVESLPGAAPESAPSAEVASSTTANPPAAADPVAAENAATDVVAAIVEPTFVAPPVDPLPGGASLGDLGAPSETVQAPEAPSLDGETIAGRVKLLQVARALLVEWFPDLGEGARREADELASLLTDRSPQELAALRFLAGTTSEEWRALASDGDDQTTVRAALARRLGRAGEQVGAE
jgi:DNA-binding response OmpR family regulator